ncbi:hypothetical protein [Tepidiforma sp.]|uniref:hypothetical protein n=1 Tax=Tepidiforma sp. TaxID=2682230 RepID=UPI002ADDBE9C|nr:hypothetical protein [Tepidiforma sp.]
MSGEPFRSRVATLRDAWAERRALRAIAGAHDQASQFALLRTLWGWAREAAEDIRAVYGPSLDVALSPEPTPGTANPAFTLRIAGEYTLAFSLAERRRAGGSRWSIAVTISTAGEGSVTPAGPERRNGQWTRSRLQELILSVLGAYERSR